MILDAGKRFPDRPWEGLDADRDALLARAWDAKAGRWNDRPAVDFDTAYAVPDSTRWVHNEADESLAALDFSNGFARHQQLAVSAQTWLDDSVDRESSAGEVVARPTRDRIGEDVRKSFFGKSGQSAALPPRSPRRQGRVLGIDLVHAAPYPASEGSRMRVAPISRKLISCKRRA